MLTEFLVYLYYGLLDGNQATLVGKVKIVGYNYYSNSRRIWVCWQTFNPEYFRTH